VSPTRRRDAVAFLVRRHHVSERRACRVVGAHRSTHRYVAVPGDLEQRLIKAMHQHAELHPRWGYRRVHALLVEEGWPVNVKRVHRLWVLEGLMVPKARKHRGQKAIGGESNSAWALPAVRPNHVWSYDFVAARTADGAPLRILNIVDEFTREAVASHVARSIGARDITRVLGCVTAAFVAKASPQQNCYVERFNGSMRDEAAQGRAVPHPARGPRRGRRLDRVL
jgi:putative transposase